MFSVSRRTRRLLLLYLFVSDTTLQTLKLLVSSPFSSSVFEVVSVRVRTR